jgi:hypothetical protein
VRISAATAAGSESATACEARTSTVCAPARCAMKRWTSGWIASSPVATRYHEGLVCQPADPACSSSAAAAIGRCVTAMTAAVAAGTSAAKTAWNASGHR